MSKGQFKVAVIDDSAFICELWKLKFSKAPGIATYARPADFLGDFRSWGEQEALEIIIIDFFFDNEPGTTGVELAKELRKLGCNSKLILSTDCPLVEHDGLFDFVIPKEPLDETDLRSLLITQRAIV